MKAIQIHQFGDPGVMRLEDVAEPTIAPGQVKVKLHAIGVNPVDTYIRAGWYGPKPFPFIPGADAAGVVETVADDVTGFKPGDRVYVAGTVSGAYAEKTVATTARTFHLPDHVSFEQGAALGVPYGTAYRALVIRGNAKGGETLLVHGASGGVGVALVQIAGILGMTIIGTASTEAGQKLVLEQGAHHVINHHASDHFKQIMDLTGGKGVDMIAEMLSNVNLANDLTVLAPRGRIMVIGSRGRIEIDPRDALRREADIRGISLMTTTDDELRSMHAFLYAGLDNRTLRPIIGKELPLSDAARSHQEVMDSGSYGKIVLIPAREG